MKDSNCTIRQGNQYTGINITGKKNIELKIDINRTQCLSAIIQQSPDQYLLTPPTHLLFFFPAHFSLHCLHNLNEIPEKGY